jgi:two-component system response regulator HydG
VLEQAQQVAARDTTVLLLGESGTGKELLARAIQQSSPRRDSPFVTVNVGSLPGSLIDSELFGHVKGAFTGAAQTRRGKFELAEGGTIFLDEIGDLAPELQGKLLRVLQDGEIQRLGEERTRHVDARVIAATNRDLERMVADGEFREDLYYRLAIVPLTLPPLRARKDDIPPLVAHFLRKSGASSQFDDEAMGLLQRYDWPGNVRELENAMERAVALARGSRVAFEDLPEEVRQAFLKPVVNGGAVQPLGEVEREYILAVLELNGGNQTRTAKQLGIGSATLYRKLKKYGLIGQTPAMRSKGLKQQPKQ